VTDATTTPPASPPASPSGHRKGWIIGGVLAALVVAAGVAVWYFVFRDTAPPPVNIERASESVDTKPNGTNATSSPDGTWTIDPSVGSFSDFTSSFVGYRVNEELAGVGAKTASGRTPEVSGTLVIDGGSATTVDITADLTTLQSDESFRDNAMRDQALQTSTFPDATFTLTEPISLGDVPAEGQTVKVDATGDLTLHGVTKEVKIPLEAKLVKGVVVVTGQIDIPFADYDIEKPVAARVLSIEDHGIMELQLFFTKQP